MGLFPWIVLVGGQDLWTRELNSVCTNHFLSTKSSLQVWTWSQGRLPDALENPRQTLVLKTKCNLFWLECFWITNLCFNFSSDWLSHVHHRLKIHPVTDSYVMFSRFLKSVFRVLWNAQLCRQTEKLASPWFPRQNKKEIEFSFGNYYGRKEDLIWYLHALFSKINTFIISGM